MTRKLFYAILIPILVSVAVSIVASVYTNQALERYLTGLDTESQFRDQTETVTRPLPGSYEESLSQIDTLMTESVGVIRSTSISRQDALIRSDADGDPGVVITNDGWMLFSSEYTQGIVGDVFAYEVWIGQNAYSIEQVVSDEISGLSFVKVNASGLDPVSFGDTVSATGGELLFGASPVHGISLSAIINAREFSGGISHADYDVNWLWAVEEMPIGYPVFNSGAQLVGFVDSNDHVIPLLNVENQIRSFIRQGNIDRVGMGAHIAEAQFILNIDRDVYPVSGALVQNVIIDSPAWQAGLRSGDMILSIDGLTVTAEDTLALLLGRYESGDSIQVEYMREGERNDVKLELASRASLGY